jgi:cytochrome P450
VGSLFDQFSQGVCLSNLSFSQHEVMKGAVSMQRKLETSAVLTPEAAQCPHLGQRYQPLTGIQLEDPYAFLAQARQEEPVFYSDFLQAWVVTSYSDVLAILKQPDLFSSKETMRPIVTYSPQVYEILNTFPTGTRLVNSDGEVHKRYRAALSPAFVKERIEILEPVVREIVNHLIDQFVDAGTTDIIASLAYPTPLLVVFHLLGIPKEHMEQCKHWSDDFLAFISSQVPEEQQIQHAYSHVAFCTYLASLISEKKASPQLDLVSEIANNKEYNFTVNEMVNMLHSLVIAGHVTTTDLIGNGLKLLLDEPVRWQAICEHPEYIPQVVEEVLRLDSPVHGFFRTATQEASVGGVVIPQGARVWLVFGSANQDENQFPDAGAFDVMRFAPPARALHLAFGHGRHVCVGAILARMEARIILSVLTERLSGLRLVPSQPLVHKKTLLNRGYQELYVQWDA